MTNSFLKQVPSISQVVVLRELYKMAYTGPPEDLAVPEGKLKLITHRTSHLQPAQVEWLFK